MPIVGLLAARLPVMDGIEALIKIRELLPTCKVLHVNPLDLRDRTQAAIYAVQQGLA